jgi:phenylacetate-coenzyme A ligase PaaK-like adenylate-forming protein
LEQEVLSLEQLLFTVFRLYCHNKQHPAATPGKDGLASAVTSPKSAHEPAGTTGTATHPPYTPQQAEAFAEPLVER